MISTEHIIKNLKEELNTARMQLKEKDEKISCLSRMLQTADSDIHELTEKLFQEAYNMVNKEKAKVELSEKLQMESKMKVYVLQAEADALKLLISTSGVEFDLIQNSSLLPHMKKHNRRFFGRLFGSSKPTSSSLTKPKSSSFIPSIVENESNSGVDKIATDKTEEIDRVYLREFSEWISKGHPINSKATNEFLMRIVREDILPCIHFENAKLANEILIAIRANSLEIEPINEDISSKSTCALTLDARFCPYRVRTTESSEWITICLLARNRIAAVCDFFTYFRYLSLGIIKTDLRDSYFEIIALRKNMTLARLGQGYVPRTSLPRRGSGFF